MSRARVNGFDPTAEKYKRERRMALRSLNESLALLRAYGDNSEIRGFAEYIGEIGFEARERFMREASE
jgi:hypothetical protein